MNLPEVLDIEVTQEDIDLSLVQDCFNCPVALAASRALGGHRTFVGGSIIGVYGNYYPPEVIGMYELTGPLQNFISEFDALMPVKPLRAQVQRSK